MRKRCRCLHSAWLGIGDDLSERRGESAAKLADIDFSLEITHKHNAAPSSAPGQIGSHIQRGCGGISL